MTNPLEMFVDYLKSLGYMPQHTEIDCVLVIIHNGALLTVTIDQNCVFLSRQLIDELDYSGKSRYNIDFTDPEIFEKIKTFLETGDI